MSKTRPVRSASAQPADSVKLDSPQSVILPTLANLDQQVTQLGQALCDLASELRPILHENSFAFAGAADEPVSNTVMQKLSDLSSRIDNLDLFVSRIRTNIAL